MSSKIFYLNTCTSSLQILFSDTIYFIVGVVRPEIENYSSYFEENLFKVRNRWCRVLKQNIDDVIKHLQNILLTCILHIPVVRQLAEDLPHALLGKRLQRRLGRLLLLPELDLVPPLLEDGDAGDPGPGVLVAPHERLAAQVAAPHRLVVQHGVEVSQELDQNVLIGLRLVHSVRHLL